MTAAACAVLAAGLGGCMQTATYGTGEMPEMALIREVTGDIPLVGADKKEPIEYQPRAPLVMPPAQAAAQLPPPVETASAAVNPDWPRADEESGRVSVDEDVRIGGSQAEYQRLKPLSDAMGDRPRRRFDDNVDDRQNAAYDIVDGKNQREAFRSAINEAEGVGRTERRYLTEPPDSFRQPAPTAPQEFEEIKKKGGWGSWLFGRSG